MSKGLARSKARSHVINAGQEVQRAYVWMSEGLLDEIAGLEDEVQKIRSGLKHVSEILQVGGDDE